MKRKQGVREQAATFRSQWQAQMEGLKQKAAAKRWKQGLRRPAAGAGAAADSGPAAAAAGAGPAAAGAAAGGPASSSAARERVWRSMTKNARNADKAAAERVAAQQTLGATGRSAPQAVGAGSQQQHHHQQAQQEEQQAPVEPERLHHMAAASLHTVAKEAGSHSTHASHSSHSSHSSSSSSSHAARLRQLMEQAAALVQGRHAGAGGHGHAATAHAADAQPEGADHAAPGRHWRGHISLDQLASLLGGGSAGNAVPADQQLHRRFEAARRAQQGRHGAAAAASAAQPEGAAAQDGLQAEAEPQHTHHRQQYEHQEQPYEHQQHHYGAAHARKFANRGDVEERLSSQLAGLKRRAALKQEVQSSC